MDTVIVKLGGSVITDKNRYKQPNRRMISYLARVISEFYGKKKIILVHGAGSYGHMPVVKYGIDKGVKTDKHRLGFAETHRSVSELSNIVISELIRRKVPAVSIPPVVIFRLRNNRITKCFDEPLIRILKEGYLPVLYGDMVIDTRLGGSVLSGDQITTYLAKSMKAKKAIFVSDVRGVLDGQNKVIPVIHRGNIKELKKYIKDSGNIDVTGGMLGKVTEILRSGVHAVITDPRGLRYALEGKEKVGTTILPSR